MKWEIEEKALLINFYLYTPPLSSFGLRIWENTLFKVELFLVFNPQTIFHIHPPFHMQSITHNST